ncbi:MAG: nuclear transport factor 2 family protein [Pyrinomonadaceae bacterium]|nr:nuclear transport factor 2 family protein [Pyrinomonadaceae bacterium]
MMKSKLSLITILLIAAICACSFFAGGSSASAEPQSIAALIIAREKASVDAWQRKDKAFFEDFLSEDSTYFSIENPYLETDPKINFLPKFEKYAEMFKFNDFQMYNPRVQVYGDTAILTYNSSVSVSFGGQPINYTAKVTSVYVKQGNTWRVVHAHETMNPANK